MEQTHPFPNLERRFAFIFTGLCGMLAARMSRPGSLRVAHAQPLLMLLWGRLRRLAVRINIIIARAAAGVPPPPTRSRPANDPEPSDPAKRKGLRLPRGYFWLVYLIQETSSYGGQLECLLQEPEMIALMEIAPGLSRMLRPLCRMLGVAKTVMPPPRKSRADAPVPVADPPPQHALPDWSDREERPPWGLPAFAST